MINEAPVTFRLRLDFGAPVSRQLSFVPTSLMSYMVLLAVADLQGVEWRGCKWCGVMFPVRDARGRHALYHDDNCRQRAFQAQRRK